jgi:hypothetical protein
MLNVNRKGAGELLQGERHGNASPADGNDQSRPGLLQRLVGRDGAQEEPRRQVDLQLCRDELQYAAHAHALQAERQADGFGDGDPLRLHADGAVGQDPGLVPTRFPAFGDECSRVLGRGGVRLGSGGGLTGSAKISGTDNAQFLFDSFV